MRKLPERVKRRIVEHLACFCSHSEVVELVEHEFEITLTTRHVRAYDPMCFQCAASDRLRAYYATVRKGQTTEISAIPISHCAFRLRRLQAIYDCSVKAGNLKMATQALEQAAKEMGGLFTTTRSPPTAAS